MRVPVVADCLKDLRYQRVHPHFPGYLCLKRESVRVGRVIDLKPNFKEFWDTFLKVPGALPSEPYIKLFIDSTPSPDNLWFNDNVAGSYAPSSVRPGQPFGSVVLVEGSRKDAKYSLRDRHWELAKQHLTFDAKVDVVKLAAFLYRDYAIEAEFATAAQTLVAVFRDEFGYINVAPGDTFDTEFEALFADNSKSVDGSVWFEEVI